MPILKKKRRTKDSGLKDSSDSSTKENSSSLSNYFKAKASVRKCSICNATFTTKSKSSHCPTCRSETYQFGAPKVASSLCKDLPSPASNAPLSEEVLLITAQTPKTESSPAAQTLKTEFSPAAPPSPSSSPLSPPPSSGPEPITSLPPTTEPIPAPVPAPAAQSLPSSLPTHSPPEIVAPPPPQPSISSEEYCCFICGLPLPFKERDQSGRGDLTRRVDHIKKCGKAFGVTLSEFRDGKAAEASSTLALSPPPTSDVNSFLMSKAKEGQARPPARDLNSVLLAGAKIQKSTKEMVAETAARKKTNTWSTKGETR